MSERKTLASLERNLDRLKQMQEPHAMTDTREDALRLRIWRTDGDRVVITHTRELRDDEAESARLTRAVSAYIHALNGSPDAVAKLVEAAKKYIATNPAFRLRPVGGEGSPARMQQIDAIAVEDAFRDALAPFTGWVK